MGSRNRCSTSIVTITIAIVQYGNFAILCRLQTNQWFPIIPASLSTNILHTVHPPISEYYFLFVLSVKKGLKKKGSRNRNSVS